MDLWETRWTTTDATFLQPIVNGGVDQKWLRILLVEGLQPTQLAEGGTGVLRLGIQLAVSSGFKSPLLLPGWKHLRWQYRRLWVSNELVVFELHRGKPVRV